MTPEDLDQIRAIVREEVTTAITTAIQASEERAQEFARDIETNMLTAFHGHAKGQTARLRIAALEERMLNLETRRPPQ